MKKKVESYFCVSCARVVTLPHGAFECPVCSAVTAEVSTEPVMPLILAHSMGHIVSHALIRYEQEVTPPALPEFLLTMLATTRRAEALVGDLNERFTDECQKFGRDRAVRLYCARTLRSLPPLVWRMIGKLVVAAVKRFFPTT